MEARQKLRGALRMVALRGVEAPRQALRRRRLAWRCAYAALVNRSTVDIHIDPRARIGDGIAVEVGWKVHTVVRIGPHTRIGDGVRFRLRGGVVDLGENVDIRGNCVLAAAGGTMVFEGHNILSWASAVHCAERIRFAKYVYIAEHVTIVDNSHYHTDPDGWSYENSRSAPIDIGQDVWICPKATITSGVSLGAHAVVASNTVVVKDAPGGVLISGVPGKVVRELDLPWNQ